MKKTVHIITGISLAFYFISILFYGLLTVRSVAYEVSSIKIVPDGYDMSFQPTPARAFMSCMLVLPILLMLGAAIAAILILVRKNRPLLALPLLMLGCSIMALLLWRLLPPQAYMAAEYLFFRFNVFNMNLVELAPIVAPVLYYIFPALFLVSGVLELVLVLRERTLRLSE